MGGAVVRPVPPRTWATKEPAAIRGLATVPVRVPLSILWAPPAIAGAGGAHRMDRGKTTDPVGLIRWQGFTCRQEGCRGLSPGGVGDQLIQ